MSMMVNVFNPSLALLTDLYQVTMAYGYWKNTVADREAVFHLYFRKPPFNGGYAIASGLQSAIDFIKKLQFGDGDIGYLAQLQGNDGKPLFDRAFLVYLRRLRFTLEIDGIPEGTAVFGNEPLLRVKGPLLQCQLVETALLNLINYQTLIATKAARVCQAARGEPVLEFGLRRAQGVDGAITASRAAYVGGCEATSNLLAGKLFGIPVRGTHAHSWVMSFDSELEAFEAYAKVMPNNCVFLVDTYDTLEGVRHAIGVGNKLRERGYQLAGIRLDSGDLAYLSIEARKLLDAAGFTDTKILATNDLHEHLIENLKQQDARINVWGVGTKLVTAYDQPALGGVYKMSALRSKDGASWQYKVKASEQISKASTPGILQVRRFRDGGEGGGGFVADAIYDTLTGIAETPTIVDPNDSTRRKKIAVGTAHEDLLVPIFREGKPVYDSPPLPQIRQRTFDQLASLHPSIKRFVHPHRYPAGLEKRLFDLRNGLIAQVKGIEQDAEEASSPPPPQQQQQIEAPEPAKPQAATPAAPQRERFQPQRTFPPNRNGNGRETSAPPAPARGNPPPRQARPSPFFPRGMK